MTITSRVAIGSTLVLVLLGGTVALQRKTIGSLVRGQRRVVNVQIPRMTAALDVLARINRLEEYSRKYYVTRDPAYAKAAGEEATNIRTAVQPPARPRPEGEMQLAQRRVAAAWRRFPAADVTRDEAPAWLAERDSKEFINASTQALNDMRDQLSAVIELSRSAMEGERLRAAEAADEAESLSAAVFAAALLVSVVVIVVTVVSIKRPLGRLMTATRAVESGDLGYRIDIRSRTELALLARRFNMMLDRLCELDQLKRDFLSAVSHEIKTPLVAMEETSRVLLEQVPGPLTAAQRRMLELNLEGQMRLARLVSDLLELSRMEAGVMDYRMVPTDLAELVAVAAEIFAPTCAEQGVELQLDVVSELPHLACDRDRITQVLNNLLSNAVRFSPRGGCVQLSLATGREGDCDGVRIGVSDQGPGVPEDERERVFNRFHQGSGPRAATNLGLGLAVCREIVDAHGGVIRVSDAPDGGAHFELWLPSRQDEESPGGGTIDERRSPCAGPQSSA